MVRVKVLANGRISPLFSFRMPQSIGLDSAYCISTYAKSLSFNMTDGSLLRYRAHAIWSRYSSVFAAPQRSEPMSRAAPLIWFVLDSCPRTVRNRKRDPTGTGMPYLQTCPTCNEGCDAGRLKIPGTWQGSGG